MFHLSPFPFPLSFFLDLPLCLFLSFFPSLLFCLHLFQQRQGLTLLHLAELDNRCLGIAAKDKTAFPVLPHIDCLRGDAGKLCKTLLG